MFYTMTRLQKKPESYGSVEKLREAGGIHRPELDGTNGTLWNLLETTCIVQARARLTPTLTHVVTYELVTSGAEDRAMSRSLIDENEGQLHNMADRKRRAIATASDFRI